MTLRNRTITPVIEKTVYESNGHYGSSNNCGTKERANPNLIPKIICIVFAIISFFGRINNYTNEGSKIPTNINESYYSYSYREFYRMTHISIVANEKGYDITYLQITEEITWYIKFERFEEFTYILQDISFQIVINILDLIVNLYNVTWSKRRKKRNS